MIAVIECVDRCLVENMTDVNQIQARCNVWAKNKILNKIYEEKLKYVDDDFILDELESPEDMSRLILSVRQELTPRQLQIFDMLLEGKSKDEIVDELHILERVYWHHCQKIREKIKN